MKVTALKLKDRWFDNFWEEVDPAWDYDDFLTEKARGHFEDWISFDCLLADEGRNTVWCGVAAFSGEIFYAWDRGTRQFRNMRYREVGDRYDAKFHRSLLYDAEGKIWAATALLHDPAQYWDAPGGALVHFDPETEAIRIVARPIPHHYIQSIEIDRRRGILYLQTWPHECLYRYDIPTGQTTLLAPLGQLCGIGIGLVQAEQISVDKNGTLWGGCSVNRAWGHTAGPHPYRLFRYHPEEGKVHFLKQGLPRLYGRGGTERVDGTATGPDGAVYMSTGEGLLCRIDPESGEVQPIGRPGTGKEQRLSAMITGPNGRLYGSCGRGGLAEIFSLDPANGKLVNHGPIYNPEINLHAWQIHNLAIMQDGTIYAGENDVPHRSSFLWEISGVA